MKKFADNLWVGNSRDALVADVDCILNVAKDLMGVRGWPSIEYAQVGLVDGPGNPLSAYHAAALALAAMMRTGRRVLVHCHEGRSRSVSVAVMYLHLVGGGGWDGTLARVRERVDAEVPDPHAAHRAAFDKMDWRLLAGALED